METAVISSEYQIIIPTTIRQSMSIRPGQIVQIIGYENRIELIPLKPAKKMRGFLKGIDPTVKRYR